MVGSQSTISQLNPCWRCGSKFTSQTVQNSIKCKLCKRLFHRKCYLAETGTDKLDSTPCICCSCGILQFPHPSHIKNNSLASKFIRDGYCVISLATGAKEKKNLLETLERYRVNAERYFTAFMRSYESEIEFSTNVPTLQSGFSNFRQRGNGRFEIISPEIEKEVLSILDNCDSLLSCLDTLLTTTITKGKQTKLTKKLMSTGCFYSLPGSSTQNLHTDGPPLSSVIDLYPYAINVFIPLVPVDKNNGTEIFSGSHRIEWQSKSELKRKSITPNIPLGNALLFDYRVLHRGLSNRKGSPRPCYYATLARSWYEDKYNFSTNRYRKALPIPSYLLERRSDENGNKRRRIE